MIYATRPGDVAFENARMTLKLIEHMRNCLRDKEKGWILFPDDIVFFDYPTLTCEVAPRITFKMVIGREGFEYKDGKEILEENKSLKEKMGQVVKVSNWINVNLLQNKVIDELN